ncbi:hypothetical protein FLA105534_04780 [Flavobacterium bizetiae]|uniref:Uncharacterized protein n=1 Tax=Flavobacterium bizetiae TaxID=2704140 RepID=A0A6J4GYW2_9FLAO|nr:hypothetical protein [Flavobacterium bizetiae]UTN02975.1 hypothetical protein L0669_16745 [Flavobacterium bizetiae]CAA9203600.1 hypothetical protein FLA105534_04780 [Flavobacterium bizetiae]CAD5344921.1 hypothetical protein FLA105535_04933 [Flavobacterium bizetiae]CAD5350925.1 hypothetical protein FLA105534_04926 [Flavobacterium bizetiae]
MEDNNYDFLLKNVASPLDYSEGYYLVYVEVPKPSKTISNIISKHAKITSELEFGYLCEVHMQGIPEIARSLSLKNHAIYQMVRLVRLSKSSDNKQV